jgi:hypothetical protein
VLNTKLIVHIFLTPDTLEALTKLVRQSGVVPEVDDNDADNSSFIAQRPKAIQSFNLHTIVSTAYNAGMLSALEPYFKKAWIGHAYHSRDCASRCVLDARPFGHLQIWEGFREADGR